ncbi:MAG TPA: ATP-binding protein [Pyrinomonadaceae bacterium]|nr:ATP-binding protein [Pyrinomonadaceae bacterium]
MSLRLTFALVLLGAGLAAIANPVWNLRAGLALFFALLTGAALAKLLPHEKGGAGAPLRAGSPATIEQAEKRTHGGGPAPADALLKATMNGMREGVLVLDQAMRVVASNRAARQVFDQVEGALESHRLSELTRNSFIYSAFRAALERGERAEVKVEMRGDERRVFDLRVVPLRLDDEKNSRGAIGVFFDITQLEHLERVRQEFLSNVSHELRTPLTAILAFVETLEEGAVDDLENNRRFLSVIRKNAVRMHNLIDDILELSAIEAGKVLIEPKDVGLHSVVSDVITALAARADSRRITIRNEVPAGATVFADARRLEQMLTNLIDNAIKFNREGGVVKIRHEQGARDLISITDTGEGIPVEHVERIFERFYRVDRARSRELGGTGLGLAIVKHLARAHGGEVSVHSKIGEGSTFIIDLPASSNGSHHPQLSTPKN